MNFSKNYHNNLKIAKLLKIPIRLQGESNVSTPFIHSVRGSLRIRTGHNPGRGRVWSPTTDGGDALKALTVLLAFEELADFSLVMRQTIDCPKLEHKICHKIRLQSLTTRLIRLSEKTVCCGGSWQEAYSTFLLKFAKVWEEINDTT